MTLCTKILGNMWVMQGLHRSRVWQLLDPTSDLLLAWALDSSCSSELPAYCRQWGPRYVPMRWSQIHTLAVVSHSSTVPQDDFQLKLVIVYWSMWYKIQGTQLHNATPCCPSFNPDTGVNSSEGSSGSVYAAYGLTSCSTGVFCHARLCQEQIPQTLSTSCALHSLPEPRPLLSSNSVFATRQSQQILDGSTYSSGQRTLQDTEGPYPGA